MIALSPQAAAQLLVRVLGGPGSGNFGHAGRPGQKGGSAPESDPKTETRERGTVVTKSKLGTIAIEREHSAPGMFDFKGKVRYIARRKNGETVGTRGTLREAKELLRQPKNREMFPSGYLSPDVEWKNLGGKGSGNFGHAGRPGERGGSGEGGSQKVRSERSLRALKAFIPIHAASQRHCENNELEVRKLVGGKRTHDNLPVDVITTIDGKVKGIEVKTMVNNSNDKITMRKAAVQKKEKWARSNHASVHTVVIDDRKRFNHKGYSGHRLYHAKGSGSFRLSGMTKVRDSKHLKELLSK